MPEIIDPFDKAPISKKIVDPFEKKDSSALKAAGKASVEAATPALGGLAGAGLAMATAAPYAAAAGPWAPAVEIGAALAGGFAGSAAFSKIQDVVLDVIPKEILKEVGFDKQVREKERREHPYASFAGELAPNLAAMRPGSASLATRGIMGSMGAGIEAGQELAHEGKIDPTKVGMAGAFTAATPKLTALGKVFMGAGAPNSKLVSTAFKNKQTGEIVPTGPKHPEDLKVKTTDTHEQGFIDEKGQFLSRKEAESRAKEIGQIPKEQPLERPEEGLHSGDLRAAKDVAFELKKEPSETITAAEEVKTKEEQFKVEQENLKNTPENVAKSVEELIGKNINNKMADQRIVHNNAQELTSMGDKALRESIPEAIENKTIDSLSPEGQALAKKYQGLVSDVGDRAVKQGVLGGLLEDYVTHIVDWKKTDKSAIGEFVDHLISKETPKGTGMSPKSPFGKERKYKTFDELQTAIKDSGLELKTKDIAEIYKEYATSMERAIENRKLIDSLKEIKNKNGEALVKKVTEDTPRPQGWEMFDTPQFRGYAIHPDLAPALKFAFDSRDTGMFMNAAHNVSQISKRLNVVGSFFHAKSLLEAAWNATNPFHVAKEMGLASWDKLFGTEHAGITQALNQFKKGGLGDEVDSWLRSGLVASVPEDVTRGLMGITGKVADDLISKFGPKTNILERSLSATEKVTLGLFDKVTWDFLHTGLKLSTSMKYLEKAREQAIKRGEAFDEAKQKQEIARFVNNSFGGLNWFDVAAQSKTELGKRMAMAAYNPNGRRALQVLLFAPDWTISTIRAFTEALPKTLDPRKMHPIEAIKGMRTPKTQQDYARLYQFKTAVTYLTLLNGINMVVGGRPLWENKDPTRIEDKEGHSWQAMKHAMEPYHWIADPDKTVANKLGFLPRITAVGLFGLEYASPTAPKLEDLSALGRTKAASATVLPFQAQASMKAPTGEAIRRAAMGTIGIPEYGSTPQEKKAERAARAKRDREKARKYRESQR